MATNTTSLLLQHPTHHHPLVLLDLSDSRPCVLCLRKISTEAYTCQEEGCLDFYCHRSCAEAPSQINSHPLHPNHPLTLLHLRRRGFFCDFCSAPFQYKNSSFRCDECDFDLDIGCAFSTLSDRGASPRGKPPEQITLPLHRHPLTSLDTRHEFVQLGNCEICKEQVEGDGYMCFSRDCGFLIHKRCFQDLYYADGTKAPRIYHRHQLEISVGEDTGSNSSATEFISCGNCKVLIPRDRNQVVPEILQYPPHPDHPLVLFIKDRHFLNQQNLLQCGSCSGYMKGEWYYGCTSYDFFVHVGCALQTLAYCQDGMSASIKWTWHEHPLLLCPRFEHFWLYCYYCGDKSTSPMYACQERGCGFLLHK